MAQKNSGTIPHIFEACNGYQLSYSRYGAMRGNIGNSKWRLNLSIWGTHKRCHVGLPVEYAGSYQQDCIGLLLSSPLDSTTSTLPRQGRSAKTRIGSCVVEDRLLQRRTRWTMYVHAISLAPLQRVINAAARFVANLRPRDHMSAMFYAICIGSQSVSEYHTRCAS